MKLVKPVVSLVTLALALPLVLAACGGGEPEERTFELEIRDGSLVQEESMLRVKDGDMVTVVVTADEPVSFHLHGYDCRPSAIMGLR